MIVHGGIQLPSPSVNGIFLQANGNLVKLLEKKLQMKECCQVCAANMSPLTTFAV
jgi:hypothetical protein